MSKDEETTEDGKHVGTRPPKPPKTTEEETEEKHVGTRPPKPPKN